MPQIWPMNWLILFLFFLICFLTFINFIYFYFSISPLNLEDCEFKKNIKTLNWMW